MDESQQQLVDSKVFTLAPDALARFVELSFVAEHYPLVAGNNETVADSLHIYWDTADYRLLRTGFAVRLEQTGDQLQLVVENQATTLQGKLDKEISRRVSITEPIGAGKVAANLKAWPKPLRKAVAAVLAGHVKLHPILRLQHKRMEYAIMAATAHATANLAAPATLAHIHVDLATVWAPTDSSAADLNHLSAPDPACAVTTLGELSLAVSPHAATEQAAITAWLLNEEGLQPAHQSLFARAMSVAGLHVPGTSTSLQPQIPVAEACRSIWRDQLLQMLLQEAGVRYSQEREYVHEMRVAIRRARAAAKLYGDFLPRKTIRPYLAALRKTGRVLGHVRNLDVAISKGRRLRTADGESARAPKKLLKEWQKQRQAAQQTLVKWLDSTEYNEFLEDFQRFCTTTKPLDKRASKHHMPEHTTTATSQEVRHIIPTLIMACYADVRAYENRVLIPAAIDASTDLPPGLSTEIPVDYEALHDLRIACKSLRYNLEFTHHLLGPESEGLIKQVKALQDLLGDLNDTVTALALLEEAENTEVAGDYQQAQAQLMLDLSVRVPAALATLVAPASRQLLGRMLAIL